MDNKAKKIKKAFSLVELIVGITISMILMVSIGIFINSGMQTIFLQQKSMNNSLNINDFSKDLYETFGNINSTGAFIGINNNNITFKSSQNFNKGGFTYIGIKEIDGYFCNDIDSEDTRTKHVFIKNFIPFIENSENLDDFDKIIESNEVTLNGINYKTLQKEHKVVDGEGNTIIGKGFFGYDFQDGEQATNIFLNSPTGIATDGEVLYISDTLNNRVLYMSGTTIHKLLDQNDGLNEPTGLYYDSVDKALYIANSGLGEILKYSSDIILIPDKNLEFNGINETNISRIYLDFYRNSLDYNINSVDIDTSDFNIEEHDFKIINNKTLSYTFREAILNGSGAIIGYQNDPKNFIGTNNYQIGLSNLSNFSEPGNYSINLRIGSSEKNFYYMTQGDQKIHTKNDNKLEIVQSGLNYPNGIWGTGINDFNEFNINSVNDLDIDFKSDIVLKTPINELDITENNDLITIITKYYRNYNCFNIDQNDKKINTFLSKINIK